MIGGGMTEALVAPFIGAAVGAAAGAMVVGIIGASSFEPPSTVSSSAVVTLAAAGLAWLVACTPLMRLPSETVREASGTRGEGRRTFGLEWQRVERDRLLLERLSEPGAPAAASPMERRGDWRGDWASPPTREAGERFGERAAPGGVNLIRGDGAEGYRKPVERRSTLISAGSG